jgi:acyl carrier protein
MEGLMEDPRTAAVLDIIAENSGIDRARLMPNVTLDELGITSLKLIEAVFEIETHYDIEISTDGILMTPEVTVGELLQRVFDTIDGKLSVAGQGTP